MKSAACHRSPTYLALLGVLATAGEARAVDPFEIQVYDGTANHRFVTGLELHTNVVASGETSAAPPELAPNHQTHFTLEPSFGLTETWEIGGYLQTTLRPTGQFEVAGAKLRSKLVTPAAWRPHLRLGVNLELSLSRRTYDRERWGVETRPIVAWENPRWLLAVNPIVSASFSGAPAAFEPAMMALFKFTGFVSVGLEYYADLGPLRSCLRSCLPLAQQEHYVFEVANLGVRGFDVNVGIGEGLTAGSNRLVAKVIVGHRFEGM